MAAEKTTKDGRTAGEGAGRPDAGRPKGGVLGSLRTGGCLIAVFAFLLLLTGVAVFYRPPRAPAPGGGGGTGTEDAGPEISLPVIRAVALSPDGTILASGGDDSEGGRYRIQLRRVAEGRFVDRDVPLLSIAAHDDRVWAIRFRAPEGRELLSVSQDGTVGWWKAEDGSPLGPGTAGGPQGGCGAGSPFRPMGMGRRFEPIYLLGPRDAGAPAIAPGHAPWPEDGRSCLGPRGPLAGLPPDVTASISGGGGGLLVGWDLAQKAGRVVSVDGKTPDVRALLMRQIENGRDADFVITATRPTPSRGGVLAADYRGCVLLVVTSGPCRDWWLGKDVPRANCLRPLLDSRRICTPLGRPAGEAAVPFVALAPYPGLETGFVGISFDEKYYLFRSADALPWREFMGTSDRTDTVGGFDADPAGAFYVVGGRNGQLRLYEPSPDSASPDIQPKDRLP